MEKFELTESSLASMYSEYSDSDLCKEYELICLCISFLVCNDVDSFIYEFLSFIEPMLVDEILDRFFRSSGMKHVKLSE